MSENLNLVRSIYADWERGEWGSADWAHPEIELLSPDGPTPGTWTGLTAMAEVWRENLSAFSCFRVNADEYCELDGDRVLVFHTWSGRGKASGVEVERMQARSATLFHIRGSKVIRLVAYWDRDRALADLGLEA